MVIVDVSVVELEVGNSGRPVGCKGLASARSDVDALVVTVLVSHPA